MRTLLKHQRSQFGFTLIELLIVIGIIAILAGIIFVAVDPARRLGEARDAERWSSTNALLNAVLKFTVDNGGTLPTSLTAQPAGTTLGIGTGSCGGNCTATTTTACADLSGDLVDEYVAAIPIDPSTGTAAITDYYVYRSPNGRITVGSCEPERAAAISVTR